MHTSIPRALSSHSLAIVNDYAYVFGGEQQARRPVDNAMHAYTLPGASELLAATFHADYDHIVPEAGGGGPVPPPRVGHTGAAIGALIYVFGGCDSPAMAPLEERGRLWIFNTANRKWTHLDPVPASPIPSARSYHTSVATNISFTGTSDGLAAAGTVLVHAGRKENVRFNDTWAFDVASRTWKQLPDGPAPPRGGPAVAFAQGKLWRFGGFDGNRELGGQLDFLDMRAPREWSSVPVPDGQGPGPRCVAGMQLMTAAGGREYLVVFGGERAPSAQGHAGAGRFWGDVWAYALGEEAGWRQVETDDTEKMGERGWFASAGGIRGGSAVLLWGGLNAQNRREDDGWLLSLR